MKRLINILFIVGALMLLVGAASYITHWALSPYMFTTGAFMVLIAQFFTPPHGESITLRRLRRQQLLGAILLVLAGVLMFVTHGNEWILCMTIAAVLQLYTSFRIPNEEEKCKNK